MAKLKIDPSNWLCWHEWEHIVGFEETSLVNTVYFANYIVWQGSCRESFIHNCFPEISKPLMSGNIALITKSCSCDFVGIRGLYALEDLLIRMSVLRFRGGRCTLGFAYYNRSNNMDLVALGEQEVHCYNKSANTLVPATFPIRMLAAFPSASASVNVQKAIDDARAFAENLDGA